MPDLWFIMVFALHLLGDFYFQTDLRASKKDQEVSSVLIHCLIYGSPFLVLLALIPRSKDLLVGILLVTGTHAVIDLMKFLIQQRIHTRRKHLFIIDQVLHLLCLFLISWRLLSVLPVPDLLARYHTYAAVGVFILSLLKPATIIFRNTIRDTLVLPEVRDDMSSTNNAGRMIGNMERLIIGTALIAGQYTGIALVLAAKTIARHKQLEDQAFAEYYLIGTLYSILYTIVMYVLIVHPVLS